MRYSTAILAFLFCSVSVIPPVVAQVKTAEKALKQDRHEEALLAVDRAIEDEPGNSEAYELKGRIYERMAAAVDGADRLPLLSNMRDAYGEAASRDAETAKKANAALTLAYINEFQQGVEAFNMAQSSGDKTHFDVAAGYFDGCSIIAPDSTGPYVNKAFAMISAGKPEKAIEPFELAVEHGERSEDTYTYLADLYMRNERVDDAVPLLEDATSAFPESDGLQNMLMNAYVLANQIDRAIKVYSGAVATEPDNKLYRYNYGSLLLQGEMHDEAIEQLKEAVRIDPEYSDAQYNLGAAYVNKAVWVNDEINRIDDELRENRSSMSAADVSASDTKIETLADERRSLFDMAIDPLTKAKAMNEAQGTDVTQICQVLFQSYAQTGRMEEATGVEACAGY